MLAKTKAGLVALLAVPALTVGFAGQAQADGYCGAGRVCMWEDGNYEGSRQADPEQSCHPRQSFPLHRSHSSRAVLGKTRTSVSSSESPSQPAPKPEPIRPSPMTTETRGGSGSER